MCEKNKHNPARVRLTLYNNLSYIIQTSPLIDKEWQLNDRGLVLGIYKLKQKEINKWANCKINNRLVYEHAAQYAIQEQYDDALILNSFNTIVDSTIANVFIVKENKICTPSLTEGCIAGVIRTYIIENLSSLFYIIEKPLTIQNIEDADEIFLTNAIRGVQWVKMFKEKNYTNRITKKIFSYIKNLINDGIS